MDSAVDQALLSLIQVFVSRQRLVLEAMEDVCPHLLFQVRGRGDTPPREFFAEIGRIQQQFSKPQDGIWRGEWKHFWHGMGCELIHLQTGAYRVGCAASPYIRPLLGRQLDNMGIIAASL